VDTWNYVVIGALVLVVVVLLVVRSRQQSG
jgi:hypothetical protein